MVEREKEGLFDTPLIREKEGYKFCPICSSCISTMKPEGILVYSCHNKDCKKSKGWHKFPFTEKPEPKEGSQLKGKCYKCGEPNENCMYKVDKNICTFSIGSIASEDRGVCDKAVDFTDSGTGTKGAPKECPDFRPSDCENKTCNPISPEKCKACGTGKEPEAKGEGVKSALNDKAISIDRLFYILLNCKNYKEIVIEKVCRYTGYCEYQKDYGAIVSNVLTNEHNLLYEVIIDIFKSEKSKCAEGLVGEIEKLPAMISRDSIIDIIRKGVL